VAKFVSIFLIAKKLKKKILHLLWVLQENFSAVHWLLKTTFTQTKH